MSAGAFLKMRDGFCVKSCDCHVLSDNVDTMTSRLLRSRFAVFLAFLLGLLLLVGTPVRPVKVSAAAAGDKAVATMVMANDVADSDTAADDDTGKSSLEDNTSGGMDDILHPFDVAYLWAPMLTQAPAAGPYDVGRHDPARLLRPPEAA